MNELNVGFFDSGLGGLTAVSALRKLLPNENIAYFGDTARCPYGTRTVSELRRMALENLEFLRSKGVKAILAACGTMSANCKDILDGFDIKVVNVLEASADAMNALQGSKAVIATDASIASGSYQKAIDGCIGVPTQDFVRIVETGHTALHDEQLQTDIEKYLEPIRNIDNLLLGCTHFGIIQEAIQYYMPNTNILTASECAAARMAEYLTENDLLGSEKRLELYTSGDEKEFLKNAEVILNAT